MSKALNDKLFDFNEDQMSDVYKNLFLTAEGQLVLEDLKNRCYYKMTSFTGDNSRSNFNEGMRSVVLHIISQITHEPFNQEDTNV